jgi:ABC-2 type transport system permease protein
VIDLVRAEWIKLRTVVMNWVLVAIALLFPLAVTLLTAYFRGDEQMDARQLLEVLTGSSFVPALLVAVIAAASITSEFGFGTIRVTFTATPRRSRVLIAKAMVLVVSAVWLQTIVVLIGALGGKALAESQGSFIDFADLPTGLPALLGTVALAGIMALVGLGLGMLVRSTPAAIAMLILWPLMAEGLIGGLLQLVFDGVDIVSWMPFRVGFSIATIESFGGPERLVAGIYFGAVGIGLCALGGWAVHRKDA